MASSFICLAGTRPYEFDWANRTADDRPVLLPLVSADGWTCRASSATGSLYTASERILFGDGVMHLAYRMEGPNATIRLSPPAPVPVPPGFDTVSLWTWGNHAYYRRDPAARITLSAEFLDSDGNPFSVLVHSFDHSDWFLAQKRLPATLAPRVAKGATFIGFMVRGGPDSTDRWIELTSFAAYKEELKPLSFKPRRKRGVQAFPSAPQGLNTGDGRLPFPNVETTIIPVVAEDPDIEFKLPQDPTKWDDLAVRYRKGPWMRFAQGGGIFPADAANGAKVRFRRIANSLVADVEAPAGVKEVRFGALPDPSDATPVPMPYYSYGSNGGGTYRRPCVIATKADGKPFFMLASVDWTQSNASEVFSSSRRFDGMLGSNGGARYREAEVEKIDFTVTIYEAEERKQNFGQVENAFIRVVNQATNEELIRYDLGEDFSIETAVVIGELYRNKGEWKFNAIGSGFSGGLASLGRNYGVNV